MARGRRRGETRSKREKESPLHGLQWGPKAADTDLVPVVADQTVRKVVEDGITWEERWVCPLGVRFSQGKIHPFFHERGPISEVLLQIQANSTEGKALGTP